MILPTSYDSSLKNFRMGHRVLAVGGGGGVGLGGGGGVF